MRPLYWATLIILGILLIAILRKMMRGEGSSKGSVKRDEPDVDLSSLSIRDAARGDLISLRAAGADFEDLSFTVDAIHRYEWGSHRWFELSGKLPQGTVHLEWDEDDRLYVSLTLPGDQRRLKELGLSEADLVRFDEEQSAENTIQYEGMVYHYQSSHEAGFFEDGAGEGEGFYLWNFDADDDRTSIAIEKWEGEAFQATVSRYIDPSDIRIYRS